MDLQEILNNAVAAQRAEELKTSPQLTLGELILKLEAVGNEKLPVVFDEGKYHPTYFDSWRGSYCELALNYESAGQSSEVWYLLDQAKKTIGCTYEGYKGGSYRMGKITPVWVANYGESEGPRGEKNTMVIDVREESKMVVIVTVDVED